MDGLGELNVSESQLFKYFISKAIKDRDRSDGSDYQSDLILVQCPEDDYYYALFGRIILSIKESRKVTVKGFHLHSIRPSEFRSLGMFLVKRLEHIILNRKWVRLYSAYCDGVGYKSDRFEGPIRFAGDLIKAYRLWISIKSKDQLIGLSIDNVPVGDLVNDTYIRWRPSPTVDINDVYLLRVIQQTIKEIRLAREFFNTHRPFLYITSHANGYIQHGIAVRVALQNHVKVIAFGNRQQFAKQLSLDNWVAAKNPDNYLSDFLRLNNQKLKLDKAREALNSRINGTIDRATAYMRQSAYAESEVDIPDVSGAIVVFLHCFYDCPHGYRHTVFSDFWEWITFTIDFLLSINAKFYIKPHPSWVEESEDVYKRLCLEYPNVLKLSPLITNKQLVEAGVIGAVSVHGTVTHELAFMGIPTVSCGDNPHVAFDFCTTTTTREEYAEALAGAFSLKHDKELYKLQSLMFFYMHNLSLSDDENELLTALGKFRTYSGNKSELIDSISHFPKFLDFVSNV